MLWRFRLIWLQERERHAETVNQGFQILLTEPGQPISIHHGYFPYPVFADHL
jgi:hypothetical protein